MCRAQLNRLYDDKLRTLDARKRIYIFLNILLAEPQGDWVSVLISVLCAEPFWPLENVDGTSN